MNHPNWLLYLHLSSIDTSKVPFFTRNAQVGARFIAPNGHPFYAPDAPRA